VLLAADIGKICTVQRAFFGDEPAMPRYWFLTHVTGSGYGGLEHRENGARPAGPVLGELAGRADQAGDVHVVPAGVRHRHRRAGRVLADNGAGVRQPGALGHRQRVHVRAQGYGRSGSAPAQNPDDARMCYARLNFDSERAQMCRDDPGRADFAITEFRVLVDVAAPGDDPRLDCSYARLGRSAPSPGR
jgi:hypothetical protein